MNVKTMEGIAGADKNMKLLHTPFKVYKDARRRGDQATMERAMGYVAEYKEKVEVYQEKAEDGMKEEAEEMREKAKAEAEKAVQERRDEAEKAQEGTDAEREKTDTVELSEEGKALLGESLETGCVKHSASKEERGQEPVFYTKAGEAVRYVDTEHQVFR